MNVSNAAYHKPLTVYNPGLQKEGIDAGKVGGEDGWYPATEKVMPRVYHKYLKEKDLENIYGPAEEDNPDDPTPDPEPQPEPKPEPTPDPEPQPEPEPEQP